MELTQEYTGTIAPDPDNLKPGVYKMGFDAYRNLDAISASGLNWFKRSPAHYKAALEADRKQTPALLFGEAQHCLLLQPELFESTYTVLGEGERRKGGDTRKTLRFNEYEQLKAIQQAFVSHPYAQHFIEFSTRELSIVWEDRSSNADIRFLCKGRMDALVSINGVTSIVDLKTTTDARPAAFERSIYKYGYHRQGAFYLRGARALGLEPKHFVIIAIEKQEPFGIGIFRLMDEAVDVGMKDMESLLALYAMCKSTNNWPSYDPDVVDIGLPAWALSMEGYDDE